jgi:hypothetical protein
MKVAATNLAGFDPAATGLRLNNFPLPVDNIQIPLHHRVAGIAGLSQFKVWREDFNRERTAVKQVVGTDDGIAMRTFPFKVVRGNRTCGR